jgi:hypothetical protein
MNLERSYWNFCEVISLFTNISTNMTAHNDDKYTLYITWYFGDDNIKEKRKIEQK